MRGNGMSEMSDYVVLTAVLQFRTRYVIPTSDIKDCDPETFIKDSVTCNEAEEFSQLCLNENIVDTQLMSEEEVLKLFDRDNDYLAGWSREKKIEWIGDWEVRWSAENFKGKDYV